MISEFLARLLGSGFQPGGGSPAGGAAFDAGVAPVHGGLSNAPGGAGDPAAYAGAPAKPAPGGDTMDLLKKIMSPASQMGADAGSGGNDMLARLLEAGAGGIATPAPQMLAPNAPQHIYAPFARR